MSYRPVRIDVQSCGLFGYSARVILEDDGLPEEECPVHGWDGPERNAWGTMLVDGVSVFDAPLSDAMRGCCCPVVCGFGMEQGPYDAFGHGRAFRKALRAVGGTLYAPMRERSAA